MHDFFANAIFSRSPGAVPLPDGESTPPMESVMRSFGDAEILPFAPAGPASRTLRSRHHRVRARRKLQPSVFGSLTSVL